MAETNSTPPSEKLQLVWTYCCQVRIAILSFLPEQFGIAPWGHPLAPADIAESSRTQRGTAHDASRFNLAVDVLGIGLHVALLRLGKAIEMPLGHDLP